MKRVSIGTLKLRVPAANKAAGKQIGLAVAHQLASQMSGLDAGDVKKIRVHMSGGGGAGTVGLSRAIAAKILSASGKQRGRG